MGKNQSASNLTNIIQYNNGNISFVSGSTTLMSISSSGAITTTGVISGSNALSASYAQTGTSASYANTSTSASYANSSSYAATAISASYSLTGTSASFAVQAQTASSADSLTVRGTLTAQTLVVQTITSSVSTITGSTNFGSLAANTHLFTGSVYMNTNGLFVSSSGLVGIGITNPSVQFNVGSNAHGTGIAYLGSNVLPSIAGLFTSDGTAGGETGYGSLLIKARSDYGSVYSLNFFTATSNNVPTERMRISSTGLVGIGTTIPTGLLHLYGSDPAFRIQSSVSGNMQFGQWDTTNNKIQSTGRNFYLLGTDAYDTIFGTNNTEKMRITSGGLIGIGTTNPSYRLQAESGGVAAYFKGGNGGYAAVAFTGDNNTTIGVLTTWSSGIYLGRANSTYGNQFGSNPDLFIASGGNVLIGNTTDNGFKLQVAGNVKSTGTIQAPNFITDSGTAAIPYGSYSTFYTVQNYQNAIYLVTLQLNGYSTYTAYATIVQNDSALVIMNQVNNNASIQVSGLNIQGTNGSGITQSMPWKVIKIA